MTEEKGIIIEVDQIDAVGDPAERNEDLPR